MASRQAGRKGSLEESRELVALASSLTECGDGVSPAAIQQKFGVEREQALKLIKILREAEVGPSSYLPLDEDDDVVYLSVSGGLAGRALRLSRAETTALLAALERIGVPDDDPIRTRLQTALAKGPLDYDLVRRLVADEGDERSAGALAECSRAIAWGRSLSFAYRRVGQDTRAPERRHVVPRGLRHESGLWYLQAYDLDRAAGRVFRVDRIDDARVGARRVDPVREQGEATEAREVTLHFLDRRLLDLLDWHELELVSDGPTEAVGRIGYYGGDWLPRMVCAGGGSVTCDDAEVSRRAAQIARELLAR